ncbi:MAG: class I SAM-dependent methyltransferase [Haloechinothrix sp.]
MLSEDWDAKFAASDFLFTDRPNQTLVAEVAGLETGHALDLGAGQGRNAVWLAAQGWQVTAVDFSQVGLAQAADLADAKGVELSFVLADAVDWTPPVNAFDLVLVCYLQLPAAELRGVLTGAAAAVASGGTMLVIGHDRDNLTRGTGGPQDPDVLYTVDEVSQALPGLRIERAERFDRLVDTELGPTHAIDTVVRATRP